MSDYAQTITLKDVKVGDRWIGVNTIGPVTINGATPGNALTRVVMNFRLGAATYTLDSSGTSPGITISNSATWTATIPARDSFLTRAGKWEWDMEFYQSGYTNPWTLYKGTITVHDDVT
jgi:hypothetical protein